ncbi:hypothetical protein MHYP_G00268480 [Metynnis hypsauchen]
MAGGEEEVELVQVMSSKVIERSHYISMENSRFWHRYASEELLNPLYQTTILEKMKQRKLNFADNLFARLK